MENGMEGRKPGAKECVMRLYSHAFVKVRSFWSFFIAAGVDISIFQFFFFNLEVRGQRESKEFEEMLLVF